MSNTTRTRQTTTSSSARTLRSVPDQNTAAIRRADTEDKLWAALHAHPNSTAVDLSAAAKLGKSTAQKILAKWAADGTVTRTAGIAKDGRRAPDLWAITDTDTTADDTTSDPGSAHSTPVPANTAKDELPAQVIPDTAEAGGAAPEEASTESAGSDTVDHADEAPDATNTAATDMVDTEPVTVEPAQAGNSSATVNGTPNDSPAADDGNAAINGSRKTKPERLAPGALRGMVEDYLRDHPDEEFGPTAIAKALDGKSSGAVSNALDKLVVVGIAVKTKDQPRRFALAVAEHDSDPAPMN